MPSRDLKDAHPDLQRAFTEIAARFATWFPGWKLIVVTTYRSAAEQLIEYRAGRSQLDGTRKVGRHNSKPSNAIDVMIVSPSGVLIDGLFANGKVSREMFVAMYGLVGQWAQEIGLRWGGDWDGDKVPVGPDPTESFDDIYHIERLNP